MPWLRSSPRGGREESAHHGDDPVARVFQHVVSGICEALRAGVGKAPAPFAQECIIENEVARPPANQLGNFLQPVQVLVGPLGGGVAGIVRTQGNILHETQRRDAIVPRVVGEQVARPHRAGQRFDHGHPGRPPGKRIESAHQRGAQRRVANDRQTQGEFLFRGQQEGSRVENHQAGDSFRAAARDPATDHPAPVVHHQRDVLGQSEPIEQVFQVVRPAGEIVRITRRGGFVGQSAANMVGRDHAMGVAKRADDIAIIEGPGGVAMHADDRIAAAFVHVMHAQPVEVAIVRREGVQVGQRCAWSVGHVQALNRTCRRSAVGPGIGFPLWLPRFLLHVENTG
jgi:hypothetical protein